MDMLRGKISQRITTDENFGDDLAVFGNQGKLHRAFLNIISNAIDAMEKTGGTLGLKTEARDEEVIVRITDTGVGMTQEELKRVGDPFFTTKAPGKGTGLGWYITNSIIEELKGVWRIESEPGVGTQVEIILPKLVAQPSKK
jgi:two-component system NtrC family sensor kinase